MLAVTVVDFASASSSQSAYLACVKDGVIHGANKSGACPAGTNKVRIGLGGVTGPIGSQGLQGVTGPIGSQGLQGFTGAIGPQGPAGPAGTNGATGPPGASLNPLDIATLNWYGAGVPSTFNVGQIPNGIAFDGSHIWVANGNSNTVTELIASTGAYANGTLANSSYAVGAYPVGIAFDGSHIWVANANSNTVTELVASTGAYANGTVANSSYAVGIYPWGIAFDGSHIWVANANSNTVTRL